MPSAYLSDRGLLRIGGAGARDFLQGLVTCDMEKVSATRAAFGALLTPQGKIIVDFIVSERDGAFWLDCPRDLVEDFIKQIGRAHV